MFVDLEDEAKYELDALLRSRMTERPAILEKLKETSAELHALVLAKLQALDLRIE